MPTDFGVYLLLIVRILVTAMAVVYAVFAALMSKQIGQMTQSVSMRDSVVITVLGYAHLIFAVAVLLMSLVLL